MTLTTSAPETSPAAADDGGAPVPAWRLLEPALGEAVTLLVALIVLLPLAMEWGLPSDVRDWNMRVNIAPFDMVLLVFPVWAFARRDRIRGLLGSRVARVVAGAHVAVFTAALVVHPSWLGVALGARLVAGLAVIAALGVALAVAEARSIVLGALAAAGAFQAVLAMVQSAQGHAFGLAPLDFAGPLYPFGSSLAGRGSLTHPYHLACFLIVAEVAALAGIRRARKPGLWLVALALMGAGLSVTYTRGGLIGQVALVACILLGRADRRRTFAAAAVIALGLLVGGVAFGDGWVARADDSSSTATADSGRRERFSEAIDLIEEQPAAGVGPGRYVTALHEGGQKGPLPAHNVVLHQAAELGLLGGLTTLALLALLAWRTVRAGAWACALTVPLVPFLLLDAYPYVFPVGLALSALWLGIVADACRSASGGPADDPAEAEAGTQPAAVSPAR